MRRTLLRLFLTLSALVLAVPALAQRGALEPSDPTLETGEHYDVHTFEGSAGSTLTVDLTSDEFDVFLIVLNPDNSVLTQVDDSDGHGLNVRTSVTLPTTGAYPVIVTSAYAGETGRYVLTVTSDGAPDVDAPAAQQAPDFSGAFTDGQLTVTLEGTGASYTGRITLDGQDYPATARADGSTVTGTFQSGGSSFDFTATLAGDTLTLQSGGVTYALTRQGTAPPANNPLANNPLGAPRTPPTNAAPAPAAPPVNASPLVPRVQPRPGHITGTVFDTQGQPLAGAGVLITGTTFGQGQRTSFETTTDANGTYSVRVPDGRYEASAWVNVTFDGSFFSRLLHPLSGDPRTAVDSTVGGNLDFQWRLSGLTAYATPPGRDPTDFYGASIDLSYCGLPASAYCSAAYDDFPATVPPAGSTVRLTLTPTGPRIDGSPGQELNFEIPVSAQLPDYPSGAGGGRLVLGTDWEYHSADINDIPLGTYLLTATATLPDGAVHPMKVGLDAEGREPYVGAGHLLALGIVRSAPLHRRWHHAADGLHSGLKRGACAVATHAGGGPVVARAARGRDLLEPEDGWHRIPGRPRRHNAWRLRPRRGSPPPAAQGVQPPSSSGWFHEGAP